MVLLKHIFPLRFIFSSVSEIIGRQNDTKGPRLESFAREAREKIEHLRKKVVFHVNFIGFVLLLKHIFPLRFIFFFSFRNYWQAK